MKSLIIKIIKIYQKYFSPFMVSSCRFEPTCSNYMVEAIKKYGVLKGIRLGIIRIMKCNPFHTGGYDPVK